jgi:5'-methylthioadenosine phosphorylase
MGKALLGIVGGSGVYDLPQLEGGRWQAFDTPWGQPSDELRLGTIAGKDVVFLPRHGRGHRYSPSDINYRANIDAMKRAGVTDLVSVSAVGSLQQELAPGTFVLVDQYIDRTFARPKSFFGKGCVAHVSMARPVSPRLLDRIEAAAKAEDIYLSRGGTYLVMEGPQFSTHAESELYRQWGAAVIGMTAMPEAKLAREAEMSYATLAMVTDYDCWHPAHDAVTVDEVIKVMNENRDKAQRLLLRLITDFPVEHEACPVRSDRALDGAIMTAPQARDPELLKKLDAVAGRVIFA